MCLICFCPEWAETRRWFNTIAFQLSLIICQAGPKTPGRTEIEWLLLCASAVDLMGKVKIKLSQCWG
jgi:hypothetical protein